MWQDLLSAFALVFVIEGILPFLNPAAYKRSMQSVLGLDERSLRRLGLGAMLVGLVMLYLVR